ncbi:MAG: riboflavin biosynthesis protein RibD [Clostridiales bacterium GWF2_36_10]|nr:MAG: riboflavin biosynthesis protein RibD [Clostridiales bacterium GWF2_36_10]HAN20880.1 bifunctional diaminohydroxyphosphoribosylaminopyrimidine deaminase/5-amino-6-(5-phosphoribosylamino)uracil reductase RibD [Clostridiales bacterium]
MSNIEYMKIAIENAKKGCGYVNPNPMVGAIIVKNKKIIGSGYHEKYGGLHAERNALESCTCSPQGATMYVTLEPCCHYGKTPPCTEAIIKNSIKRVVIGSKDPNPLVAGKGIEALILNGIEVITGVCEEECNKLNEVFFYYIKTKTPFVVMKYAMTIDGKISTYTGWSRWITGEKAREHVHQSRHRYTAIMIGVNTVISDDPLLTCRLQNGKNPVRIICDTNLRTPLNSKIIKTANDISTYIATACTDVEKQKQFINFGCKLLIIPKKEEHIDLNVLMLRLGEQNIDSVLLEGGSTINYSALQAGIVKKVQCYIAPKIFGGNTAKTPVGGLGIELPDNAFLLKDKQIIFLDDDILIEGEVIQNVHRYS